MRFNVKDYSGDLWIRCVIDNRDAEVEFGRRSYVLASWISYVEDFCGGWDKFIKRAYEYSFVEDYVQELHCADGLGVDAIWGFVLDHKYSFGKWLRACDDEQIMSVIDEHDRCIMDFKECWFREADKEDDMFLAFCCQFIGSLTLTLISHIEVDD